MAYTVTVPIGSSEFLCRGKFRPTMVFSITIGHCFSPDQLVEVFVDEPFPSRADGKSS